MLFTSLKFLCFLAVTVGLFYAAPKTRRWMVLLAASAVFYLALDVKGIFLLLVSAAVTWGCALRIQALHDEQAAWTKENKALPKPERKAAAARFDVRKKRWVLLAVAANVGTLALLKYIGGFTLAVLRPFGVEKLLIPLGISYYTLQLVGYLVDVYRTVIPAEKNFFRLTGYAAFFLSIVQGPFHRYAPFCEQLQTSPDFDWQRIWNGARRMAWGYFLKLAIADRAALIVNTVFDSYQNYSGLQQFFCMVAFGIQLYTDFNGYTNIALGAGEMLGLELPDNFRQPFFSRNMSEFWQRWHITLGAWLKDYVFYPVLKSKPLLALGKGLKGRVSKKLARSIPTWVGMFILWVTIGLWHGAGFNYVFGVGILQFLYIWVGELCEPLNQKISALLRMEKFPLVLRVWQGLRCGILMIFAWVFFEASSFDMAVDYLAHMVRNFGSRGYAPGLLLELLPNRIGFLYLMVGLLWVFAVDLLHETGHRLRAELDAAPLWLRWGVYLMGLWCMAFMGIFMSTGNGNFLYARF